MMGYGHGYGYSSWWILILLVGVIVVAIIITLIFLLVRASRSTGKSAYPTPYDMKANSTGPALAILAERYARGEITSEEYNQMKTELTKT